MAKNVFILKPSTIPTAGVGAFSCSFITKGQVINTTDNSKSFLQLEEKQIDDNYLKYCVLLTNGKYLSPLDFLKMGVFWYINHSESPNLEFKDNKLWSLEDIQPGDELTLYYSDLLTHPKNKLWYKPK